MCPVNTDHFLEIYLKLDILKRPINILDMRCDQKKQQLTEIFKNSYA